MRSVPDTCTSMGEFPVFVMVDVASLVPEFCATAICPKSIAPVDILRARSGKTSTPREVCVSRRPVESCTAMLASQLSGAYVPASVRSAKYCRYATHCSVQELPEQFEKKQALFGIW